MDTDNKNLKKDEQRSLNKSLNVKSIKHTDRSGLPETAEKNEDKD